MLEKGLRVQLPLEELKLLINSVPDEEEDQDEDEIEDQDEDDNGRLCQEDDNGIEIA